MIIAIDGTLASGKGTLAKKLASYFNLPHLDTGLLYRATGYKAYQEGLSFENFDAIEKLAKNLNLSEFDEDVLRTDKAAELASRVAIQPKVRAALLELQQRFAAQKNGAVLDGRDIGTVICPQADIKFWIDAKPEIRAKRRLMELETRGINNNFETILKALIERDTRDANRADAPMICAPDAFVIDTSALSAQQTLDMAISIVQKKMNLYV